jgi:hypothetical protein
MYKDVSVQVDTERIEVDEGKYSGASVVSELNITLHSLGSCLQVERGKYSPRS